jgi:phosphoglycerate kinase
VTKRTIDDTDLDGARVLVRVDFNVPISGAGEVGDDRRIEASLPTIRQIIGAGGTAVLLSHLGRPQGAPDPRYSLRPVAARLDALLPERTIRFSEAYDGPGASAVVAEAGPGDVVLLENVRFHPGEKANDPAYADGLAALGDLFVSDAFSICHREHASVTGVPARIPGVAGLGLASELRALAPLLEVDRTSPSPPRPFVAISGGAKVSDKIKLLDALIPRLDALLIGGAMAYTFLLARGEEVGRSRVEADRLELARALLALAEQSGTEVLLPTDHVVASSPDADAGTAAVVSRIPDDAMGLDIGPATRRAFVERIACAGTAVWNGPVGLSEKEPFAEGTRAVAEALAAQAENGGTAVVGGGETAQAAERFGASSRVSHVSTGGGAFLAFLEGAPLPGVAVLQDAEKP